MAKRLHIFKAGSWVDMNSHEVSLTADDVKKTAAAYDPKVHEAPLVLGHPETNGPAYGWVESLTEKDGNLFATTKDVNPALASMVSRGQYRKISSSFIRPNAAGNPTPGVWHLRHVGFLGAAVPAVKGLQPVQLAGRLDDGASVSFAEERGELASEMAKILAANDAHNFIEKMFQEGRIMPGERMLATALLASLSEDVTCNFAEFERDDDEPERLDAVSTFKTFLQQLPRRVLFNVELSAPSRDTPDMELSIPQGATTDPALDEIRRKAMAYAEAHKVDFRTALSRIS